MPGGALKSFEWVIGVGVLNVATPEARAVSSNVCSSRPVESTFSSCSGRGVCWKAGSMKAKTFLVFAWLQIEEATLICACKPAEPSCRLSLHNYALYLSHLMCCWTIETAPYQPPSGSNREL